MEGLLKLVPVQVVDSDIIGPITVETSASLGRSKDCDVSFNDNALSRVHCRICISSGKYILEDMGSRNGTILNKERIDVPVELKDGDEIIIGKNILRAEIETIDSTMNYDSVQLAEVEEEETTSFHNSAVLAEDLSGPSPVSMELDRRLIDHIDDDYRDSGGGKSSLNAFKWISSKMHFPKLILKAHHFVTQVTPKDLCSVPAWRNFLLMTFFWCMLTSGSIYTRLSFEEGGFLGLVHPSNLIQLLLRTGIMGIMLFIFAIVLVSVFSSLSWRIVKAFNFSVGYTTYSRIVLVCLSPALFVMTIGSVIAVFSGESTLVFLELLRMLGVSLMVLGSLYFYFLLFAALKQLSPNLKKEKKKSLIAGFSVVFFISFFCFGAVVYNISSWRNLYEAATDWESDMKISMELYEAGKYEEAEKKLSAMTLFSRNLHSKEKAETYFYLGIMKIVNKKVEEGEKDIKTGFFYSDKDQQNIFSEILEKHDIHFEEVDQDKYKDYIDIDGSYKRQNDMVTELMLDVEKFGGKNLQIHNMLYEKFGFDTPNGFENSDPWFTHAETVILQQTELMKGKGFFFYYHPLEEDREARKFVMEFTGKENKSFYLKSLKGKLIKHETSEGQVYYLFLIREMEINYKKYKGDIPSNITQTEQE